jgi:hypothetical protein
MELFISSANKFREQNAPLKSLRVKEQWVTETRIQPITSLDWLTTVHTGDSTEFISSFAVHKFEIKFPFSCSKNENHAFLTRIGIDFSLAGDTALTAIELYEGKYLVWAEKHPARRIGNLVRQPSDRFWKIRPEALITDDLRLGLAVFFGAPNIQVPEFRFHALKAELSFTEIV